MIRFLVTPYGRDINVTRAYLAHGPALKAGQLLSLGPVDGYMCWSVTKPEGESVGGILAFDSPARTKAALGRILLPETAVYEDLLVGLTGENRKEVELAGFQLHQRPEHLTPTEHLYQKLNARK